MVDQLGEIAETSNLQILFDPFAGQSDRIAYTDKGAVGASGKKFGVDTSEMARADDGEFGFRRSVEVHVRLDRVGV